MKHVAIILGAATGIFAVGFASSFLKKIPTQGA